jgi:PPP family 3-phenylpropionic acid transporter
MPGPAGLRLYYFAAFATMGVFMPYLPGWLQARGVEGAPMGLVVAARPVATIVAPVLFGLVADRLGARGVLLRWACLGALCATLTLSVLAATDALAFPAIFTLIVVFSLLRAPLASVADATTLETRASYGSVRLWGSLGFMAAALLAGRLLDFELPAAFPAAVTLTLAAAYLATFLLPARSLHPPRPVLAQARRLLRRPAIILLMATVAGWQLSHSAYDLCISLHLRDLGASGLQVGFAWAVATLAEVALLACSGTWLARFGGMTLLLVGLLGATARWALIAHVGSLPGLLLLQPLHALSFGLVWVSAMQLVREHAERTILATAQGLVAGSMALGSALGMVAWSVVYEHSCGRAVFGVATAVSAVVLLGMVAARNAVPGHDSIERRTSAD